MKQEVQLNEEKIKIVVTEIYNRFIREQFKIGEAATTLIILKKMIIQDDAEYQNLFDTLDESTKPDKDLQNYIG